MPECRATQDIRDPVCSQFGPSAESRGISETRSATTCIVMYTVLDVTPAGYSMQGWIISGAGMF